MRSNNHPKVRDYGNQPLIFNIDHAAKMNENFRIALWTGRDLQLTLMSVPPNEDIGVERHDDLDQFICIEDGKAIVMMGNRPDALLIRHPVNASDAIIVPAGTWHNIVNAGGTPLKLYSIYAPPQHPFGTVQPTKQDAEHGH